MLVELSVVAAILGTRMPPSIVKVGTTQTPSYRSVHYFDNITDLTNRVLDRSIRSDVVRAHTNLQNGEIYTQSARRNQEAVEEHCISRLTADGIKNAAKECGNGLLSRN